MKMKNEKKKLDFVTQQFRTSQYSHKLYLSKKAYILEDILFFYYNINLIPTSYTAAKNKKFKIINIKN